jgi:hypothetical protein
MNTQRKMSQHVDTHFVLHLDLSGYHENITITLEEKVARWVCVWAIEHDTCVSRFVGNLVKARMTNEFDYHRAKRRFLRRGPKRLKESSAYPEREELHERDLLR